MLTTRNNQAIVIFGAGPVGLLCMAVAKALGASRIIAVDIVPSRLEFAKTYAATGIYLPPKSEPGESQTAYSERNARTLKEQLGIDDRGAKAIDVIIDASGAAVSIQTGLHVVRTGGTFVQVCRQKFKDNMGSFAKHQDEGWDGPPRCHNPNHTANVQGSDFEGIIPLWGMHFVLCELRHLISWGATFLAR